MVDPPRNKTAPRKDLVDVFHVKKVRTHALASLCDRLDPSGIGLSNVAGCPVPGQDFHHLRSLAVTDVDGERAAGMEPAPRRRVSETRRRAFKALLRRFVPDARQ